MLTHKREILTTELNKISLSNYVFRFTHFKQILLSSNSVGANLKMYNPGGGQLAALGGNMTANGSFWLWRESDGMPLCTILSSGDGAGKVAVYDTDGMIDSVPSSDPSTEKKDNDEQD